jgi:hypothetical protein
MVFKNDTKAVKNFVKVDSMYNENGRITQIYKWLSLFNFLLQRKDDKKNQLKYITKYMDINKICKKIIRS